MDACIILSEPNNAHRVELAKKLSVLLNERFLQCEIRATTDDHTPYPASSIKAAVIIALASPGASFPAVLSGAVTQPVILLTTVAPGASEGLVGATGSASGPLARVATNSAEEAAALAARLLTSARTSSAANKNAAAVAAAREVARAVEQAVCDVALQRALGGLSTMEAAEQRTQAYGPWIEAERQRIIAAGTALGSSAVPADVLPGAKRYVGKVRDVYLLPPKAGQEGQQEAKEASEMVMVATGRQSAFDRHLASVPFKGQVLNCISLWWFEQTKHLVPNHVLYSPHPSSVVGCQATIFPIEFVVRGYMTGSTSTSMWTHYSKGARQYCGHTLPDGMVKNQKLWVNALVTPTTKSEVHDEPISAEAVVSEGHMTQADWDTCARYATQLFEFGQSVASERGLILVDTKYEFGKLPDGTIILCDELHTPDSSRYWLSAGYEERLRNGQEPQNIDKEFLRRWFVERCDPYKDETLPEVPPELTCELSRRYILLYELITGSKFAFPSPEAAGSAQTPDEELFEALRKARAAGKIHC